MMHNSTKLNEDQVKSYFENGYLIVSDALNGFEIEESWCRVRILIHIRVLKIFLQHKFASWVKEGVGGMQKFIQKIKKPKGQ
jgi:hypothetical protein